VNRVIRHCTQCGHAVEHRVPVDDNRERAMCPACGHIEYDNPRIVAGCIIEHEHKIVLAKRAIEPRHGFWTLPAGFMELGETVEQGAAREALEEANAQVDIVQLYSVYSIPRIGQVYMLFRARFADADNPAMSAGDESLEVGLFDANSTPWDDIAFTAVKLTLERYWTEAKLGKYTLYLGQI
jgi:ADP-ribose pyrophosphatase YjhB (NUDIX family)